jgi:hypothetical protein
MNNGHILALVILLALSPIAMAQSAIDDSGQLEINGQVYTLPLTIHGHKVPIPVPTPTSTSTPTPSPSSTPTPTPSPCSLGLTSPQTGATLSGTTPVTVNEANCGGNFNQLQVSNPGCQSNYNFTGTTYNWDSRQLKDGNYTMTVQAYDSQYKTPQGNAPLIGVTISNSTATPAAPTK